MIKSFPVENLKLSFQHFANVYPKLVTDANNGIRANANAVLAEYLGKLKKEAAGSAIKQVLHITDNMYSIVLTVSQNAVTILKIRIIQNPRPIRTNLRYLV